MARRQLGRSEEAPVRRRSSGRWRCWPTTTSPSTSRSVVPKPPAASTPRPTPRDWRDADLSAEDRVDLFLDLDRDFATVYRLTIDHRGWTGESCWNDATWNPTWFVANRSEDGAWTAEAAIPFAELAPQPGRPPSLGRRRATRRPRRRISILDHSRLRRRGARGLRLPDFPMISPAKLLLT